MPAAKVCVVFALKVFDPKIATVPLGMLLETPKVVVPTTISVVAATNG